MPCLERPENVDGDRQNDEENEAFKSRFVKLAGVTRKRPAAGEHDGPWNVGDTSPQFAIDEIGDASEQ